MPVPLITYFSPATLRVFSDMLGNFLEVEQLEPSGHVKQGNVIKSEGTRLTGAVNRLTIEADVICFSILVYMGSC
ncbi:hypothetical protein I312_105932 [Cryptococcus bacillisporus CA1280]|uniref:uncharacterized protein n=1 Tax=Cryptococcus bacillisporus CA1280 TaxID=1296109 RepID=UPI003367D8AC